MKPGFFLKIDGLAGYVFQENPGSSTNLSIAWEGAQEILKVKAPRDVVFGTLTAAKYIAVRRYILIETHTNPDLGVLVLFNIDDGSTKTLDFTQAASDPEGNIFFTLNPPHFGSREGTVRVFVNFKEFKKLPVERYEFSVVAGAVYLNSPRLHFSFVPKLGDWDLHALD